MCCIYGRTTDDREVQVFLTGRIVTPEAFQDDLVARKDRKIRSGENDSVIIDVVLCVCLSATV